MAAESVRNYAIERHHSYRMIVTHKFHSNFKIPQLNGTMGSEGS